MIFSLKLRVFLKLTGLVILGIGVILGYANLQEWFRRPDRQAFVQWVLESQTGMPAQEAAARAFMRRFPPPEHSRPEEITHITKHVVRPQNGGVLQASVNYMHKDHSRTTYVATLPEIREWAAETSYGWLAWALTLLGFLEVLASAVLEWREKSKPIL